MDSYQVIMMGLIIFLTPIICWLFTIQYVNARTPFNKWLQVINEQRYFLHVMGYLVIIKWKSITDAINEPIKLKTGHWTEMIYSFEGDFTLHVQNFFLNDILTSFLNFHYLFIYLFLIYVTTVYFAYTGDRDMTDKVTLNYLLIYALAVPYYLFFNVEVTSSWIPGMESLLYHDGLYSVFYATHDPLDNAVPSLHIAIPFGILLLNYLHVKEKGGTLKEWRHYRYHMFVLINTILFMFTILYLGIHWFIDIPLGLLIGGFGALFIHHLQPRLRNDHGSFFKGFTSKKIRQHLVVEGVITLLMLTAILMAVQVQTDTIDERVSFQLGPNDSRLEIIQMVGPGEQVNSNVTNLDDSLTMEVVVMIVDLAPTAMENGSIDWGVARSLGDAYIVESGSTLQLAIDSSMSYHYIMMHNPSNSTSGDVIQVRILNDYHEDMMGQAIFLSLASLWMTGFVINRIRRLKKYNRRFFDSTPSHLWEQE
ncbi:MAG: phosphatase PAP2 family protein [Euryarchaeota archaeon]|nr:phosphatase PAP2 family protein [Euryarchaeota archaeon]MBT7638714.1 phosphatase PAP2 family protein [Euryarchaeota archaeon]